MAIVAALGLIGAFATGGAARGAPADPAFAVASTTDGIEAESRRQLERLRTEVRPEVARGSSACEVGQKAFSQTVFPFIRANCVYCHGGDGPGPGFAVPDAKASYSNVLHYLNFNDFSQSRFVQIGGNYHCFKKYDYDCGVKGPEPVLAAVQAWDHGGQSGCASAGSLFTKELPVPKNLPGKTEGFVAMSFNLAVLGAAFEGASLQLEVQRFADWTAEHKGLTVSASPA